jgi:hypothetical protein
MSRVGFEPTIPMSERPSTALYRTLRVWIYRHVFLCTHGTSGNRNCDWYCRSQCNTIFFFEMIFSWFWTRSNKVNSSNDIIFANLFGMKSLINMNNQTMLWGNGIVFCSPGFVSDRPVCHVRCDMKQIHYRYCLREQNIARGLITCNSYFRWKLNWCADDDLHERLHRLKAGLIHKQSCDVYTKKKAETHPGFSLKCQKINGQLIIPYWYHIRSIKY